LVGRLVAADLAHLLGKDRRKLAPMAVGIDDRMRELCAHLRGAEMTIAGPRRREARGKNAYWNFTAPLAQASSRICVIPWAAKTAKAGCRPNG
jgi:hypothetical protein